jgi:recombination protein RecR
MSRVEEIEAAIEQLSPEEVARGCRTAFAGPAGRERQAGSVPRLQQHQRWRVVRVLPRPQPRPKVLCVVEEAPNILGIESTRQFSGLYHVLHGTLSPLKGVGPEQLKIKSLVERIGAGQIEEIIVATNPTVEGEATAVYLSKLLKPLGVKVTRIAMGIPVGSDLEFADEFTMWKAMEGRREM